MKNPKEILKETFQRFKNRERLIDDSISEITLIEKEQTESIISTNETIFQKPTIGELNMMIREELRQTESIPSIEKMNRIQKLGLTIIIEMMKEQDEEQDI
jgi:hypothetical protein